MFIKGLVLWLMNLILVSVSAYMLLRAEESLLLPPLIPAWLHIFWAVGLREGQRGIWEGMPKTRRKVPSKSIYTYPVEIQQMSISAILRENTSLYLSSLLGRMQQYMLSFPFLTISSQHFQHPTKIRQQYRAIFLFQTATYSYNSRSEHLK